MNFEGAALRSHTKALGMGNPKAIQRTVRLLCLETFSPIMSKILLSQKDELMFFSIKIGYFTTRALKQRQNNLRKIRLRHFNA
jgi:hypothetical protein